MAVRAEVTIPRETQQHRLILDTRAAARQQQDSFSLRVSARSWAQALVTAIVTTRTTGVREVRRWKSAKMRADHEPRDVNRAPPKDRDLSHSA